MAKTNLTNTPSRVPHIDPANIPASSTLDTPPANTSSAPQETPVMQNQFNPGATGQFTRFVPKISRVLTLPLMKLEEGKPVNVLILSEMFAGKDIAETDPNKKKKEPPTMVNVTDLDTGEQKQLILGATLVGILKDEYVKKGLSYVNKGFQITLGEKKRGRSGGDYNTYKVLELDLT